MSPLRLWTLGTALLFTAAFVMRFILEAAAHEAIVSRGASQILFLGVLISSISHVLAYCRDSTAAKIDAALQTAVQHFDERHDTLMATIHEYGEVCADEGRKDAHRTLTSAGVIPPPGQRNSSSVTPIRNIN